MTGHVNHCIICGAAIPEADDDCADIDALTAEGELHHYVACRGYCSERLLGYLVNNFSDKLGLRRKQAPTR